MPPQKTWFFQKGGDPFAVNEKEAWELLTNRSNWRDRTISMIGVSDGQTFYDVMKQAVPRKHELNTQVKELKEKLNKYIKAHDRLLFEELEDEDSPKVLKAKELIKKTENEIEPLENELRELSNGLYQKAFNAELEKARGNMEQPRDFDHITKAERGKEHVAANFFKRL